MFAANLDDVLIKGGHAAEMALFAVFAPAAAGATSQQLEWLLQRLLLMLAAMHQRGTGSEFLLLVYFCHVLFGVGRGDSVHSARFWHRKLCTMHILLVQCWHVQCAIFTVPEVNPHIVLNFALQAKLQAS